MNFIERIIGLFTSPDKTMADIAKEPRIEEAAVIVALYAIVSAISAYIAASHMKYVFTDPALEGMASIMTIFTAVIGLIAPFVLWVIITAVLYLFSMVFGGEGKFLALLTGIGYSQLPKIIVTLILAVLLTQAPVITYEISSSGQTRVVDGDQAVGLSSPISIAQQIIGLIGLLWSCLMGVFAVKHVLKLSTKSAALVVGIPLVIYLVISFGSAFLYGLL
ncbi:MAG: Yip1 domain protein [Methanocella sp. PtaU1.Bin125]|nr:MAG: Yip1 domain protein [Methanocella sp. PtaU1.Bin125]